MQFIEPFFLLGALSLAIPVVIHLIKLDKPERVAFSTLSFFQQLVDTTVKRMNLKRLILLALRMLALLMLVLAWAKPVAPGQSNLQKGMQGEVDILIDNSPSTAYSDENGPIIYQLVQQATAYIEQLSGSAEIRLWVTHGPWPYENRMSKEQAIARLQQIESFDGVDLSIDRLKRMLDSRSNAFNPLMIISDGQFSSTVKYLKKVADESRESETRLGILSIEEPINNAYVNQIELTSAWVSPRQQLEIAVHNEVPRSDSTNIRLRLFVNDRLIGEEALATVNRFPFTAEKAGYFKLKAIIERDELAFDNSFHAVLEVPESLNVLWVSPSAAVINQQNAPFFEVIDAAKKSGFNIQLNAKIPSSMNNSDISRADVVVLDGINKWPSFAEQALIEFVQNGGGMWIVPSPKINIQNWNERMRTLGLSGFEGFLGEYASFKRIGGFEQIKMTHPVFEKMFEVDVGAKDADWAPVVDAPNIYFHFLLPTESGRNRSILENEARIPLLVEQSLGRGRIWLMALGFDAAWSDLSIKPLFPPFVFNGLQYLKAGSTTSFITTQDLVSPLYFPRSINDQRSTAEVIFNDSTTILLQPSVLANQSVWTSGLDIWQPGYVNDEGRQFALEIPQLERELTYVELSSMDQFSEEIQQAFENGQLFELQYQTQDNKAIQASGIPLMYWLLLLAFAFLVGESLVSRFFKISAANDAK